jgi:hypothetical protein
VSFGVAMPPPRVRFKQIALALLALAASLFFSTRTISLPGAYSQWAAISPDGATLWVADNVGDYTSAGTPTNDLLAITASGTVKATLNAPAFNEGIVARPVVSPDERYVYGPSNSSISLVDAAAGRQTGEFSLPSSSAVISDLLTNRQRERVACR